MRITIENCAPQMHVDVIIELSISTDPVDKELELHDAQVALGRLSLAELVRAVEE